jgi:hypothetical protein
MVNPFLASYGQLFGDSDYTNDETANQLLIYGSHLQDPSGLLFHAYAENGATWADPATLHSPEFWGRAIGWYGMATVEVLEILPPDHPKRPQLITILQSLVAALAQYQDSATGRWFQVVDRGDLSANWLETSCSAMYTFIISRAAQRGYVDPSYADVANKGYQGVLAKISLGSDGLTNLTDISQGTNVGNLSYYLARARRTNDFHGLGSFLIMNEQLSATAAPDFSLSGEPESQTVTAGDTATYTVTVAPLEGFSDTVKLNVSGLPSDATASFDPISLGGGSGSAALSVSTSSATLEGTYTLTITGLDESGSRSHSATATLVVNSANSSAPPGTDTHIRKR